MSEQRFSLPAAPQQVPGLPENFIPVAFENFTKGLNTKPSRAAIEDDELAWCDGFFPLAPSTLRILPGTGAVFYTAPVGASIVWFGFGNIADHPFLYVLLTNGELDAYDFTAGRFFTPLPPGTIHNPRSVFGFSQWGSLYAIFASDQTNGYWLYDGTNTFTAGTLSPFVNVTNSGEGYSSPPAITVTTTGSGTGATFSSTLDGDTIGQVTVTNPGSGFAVDDFAILTFTGGGSDNQATATASLSAGGGVTSIVVTNPGSSYTFAATLAITGGGGSGATGVLNIQNGQITGVTIQTSGVGYTSPPTLTVTDPGYGSGASHISGGSGANGFAVIGSNGIGSIGVVSGGTGYTSVPTVEIIGDGTGAQANALIASGAVTGFNLINPGQGYTRALVKISGGNNAANADVALMPFGISGTTVEVYQQHVWVANGGAVASFPPKNRVLFSAPESPADFGNGGGGFLATDSFVRVGYHSLKQTNGFLYLIGDSSENAISGVQTNATPATATTPAGPPITTFSNINVDPQIGSPWPSSVQVFSRNIVFANSVGVHVSYGGAVTKVSAPLDDFYNSVPAPLTADQADFPSAVANIFGAPVYMLLLPVIDKITGLQINKLLCWNGQKWFTSQQDRGLTYIATQEFNSNLTAWGTDGINIYPLFAAVSNGFAKVAQSKLFASPAYWTTKTAIRMHAVLRTRRVDQPVLVSIDTETGAGTGSALQSIQPLGHAEADVLGPYPVGQTGRMTGFTVQTNASNLDILSIGLSEQIYSTNI